MSSVSIDAAMGVGERPAHLVPGSCDERATRSNGGTTLEEGQAGNRRSMTSEYLQGVT